MFCSLALGSLYVLPPGPPFTHNAVCSAVPNTPRMTGKDNKRMKMKSIVGACCASEWEHGSAVSPQCWLVLMLRTHFLMLCNFEDEVFEVMHELHSFPAS